MEPDSVIEDKTIELMVSAARWTVLPSVRPRAGLPTSTSGARPALALPRRLGPGLGPPLAWPRGLRGSSGSLEISGRTWPGPLHAPRFSFLPLSYIRAHLSKDPRSIMLWP